MQTPTPQKSFLTRLQTRLAAARFLTFSALIHTVIVIMGGGVVLFKQMATPPDFTAGTGELVSNETPPQPPAEPVTPPDQAVEFTAPAPTLDPRSSPILTTAAPSAPFRVDHATTVARGAKTGLPETLPGSALAKGPAGLPGGTSAPFGTPTATAPGFVGTFYDLKQTRSGKPSGVSPDEYHKIFRKFVREHWRESVLADYFRAPNKLFTPQIFIPNMSADEGPKAFDLAGKVQPSRWLVHYKARVSPPTDGTYHFVGGGDDVLIVRFNGKVVLDRCWYQQDEEWKTGRNYDYGYTGIPNGFARGDALRLKAGQFYDMEVLIGEQPGGLVFFSLLLEEEGVEYRRDARGNPILPVFRLAGGPLPELAAGQTLPPFDPVGPIWQAAPMKVGGTGFAEAFSAK